MSAPAGASAHASASPAGDNALNFGPASTLDDTVYGACRPGGAPEGGVRIPDAEVAAWAAAVSARGVTRVVSLLDDAELASYDTPLPEQYKAHFKRCALRARTRRAGRAGLHGAQRLTPPALRSADFVQLSSDPAAAEAARATLVSALREAHEAGEKVVVHCKLGQQRTGLALAAWLTAQHGLSPEAAAAEVERAAAAQALTRSVDVPKLCGFTTGAATPKP